MTIAMDNFAVRVVGGWERDGNDDLMPVLQLAMNHHGKCTGWSVRDGQTLLLHWHNGDAGVTPLLAPLTTPKDVHGLVVSWLVANPAKGELQNSDADEEPEAFEASTDQWGHGGGVHSAMIAIKPRTRWIGK